MPLYELINPSDPITFHAASDTVAFVVATWVGNGQTPAKNTETEEDVGGLFLFATEEDIAAEIKQKLGTKTIGAYISDNAEEVMQALLSFAVCDAPYRDTYDECVQRREAGQERDRFKLEYKERHRSSMNDFVAFAWRAAKQLQRQQGGS